MEAVSVLLACWAAWEGYQNRCATGGVLLVMAVVVMLAAP